MKREKKIPRSAYGLYKRLYIKRLFKEKKQTKYPNALVEATKSWFSLSDEEKKKNSQQLELYRNKYNNEFADYLKSMTPCMKKKQNISTRLDVQEECIDSDPIRQEQEEEQPPQQELDRTDNGTVNNICVTDNVQEDSQLEDIDQPKIEDNTDKKHLEPEPPNIKCTRDLFNLVKGENQTWSDLSKSERRRFQTAVLKIKKEYIMKYKLYLESLSPEELYNHYNKTI